MGLNIKPIKKIDVSGWKKKLDTLNTTSKAVAKTKDSTGGKVPGVGDVPQTVDTEIKGTAEKQSSEGKKIALNVLKGVLIGYGGMVAANATGKVVGEASQKAKDTISAIKGETSEVGTQENIDYINRQITKLNVIIGFIEEILQNLSDFISSMHKTIKLVIVVYIAAKIISMVPAITIGLGAGTAFTMHIPISEAVKTACIIILAILVAIPFAIIAIMAYLLSFLSFLAMILGMILKFLEDQLKLKKEAISDSLEIASEIENTSDVDTSYMDELGRVAVTVDADNSALGRTNRIDLMSQINDLEFQGNLVACTLPDGTVKQMTPDDCMAAGGTFGNLVSCTLPNGTVKIMTKRACLAAGGTFGTNLDDLKDRLSGLGGAPDGVCMSGPECENLSYEECLPPNCYWSDGSELIITSLKHPNRDITIEKAVARKGKRKGFYGSDI